MKKTSVLTKRSIRSLALSVHFKHPDLGMKEYEILSRASAFLLSVDPIDPSEIDAERSSSYAHLAKSRRQREQMQLKQGYLYEPAGGPQRDAKDLRWLEFCPGTFRPMAHIVASSHVLSPWLWKQYYPQPWLEHVSQSHIRYSVDVFDTEDDSAKTTKKSLATFALNPYPIHHPNDMDLALIHLKSETGALQQMQSLGVTMLHLTENDTTFDKNDKVFFQGFEITDEHYETLEQINDDIEAEKEREKNDEDVRVFMPYKTSGSLIFSSPRRFIATTPKPLPEGLCGGPVFDKDDRVCGIVEGIVPTDHKEKSIAGAASFIPYFRIREFVDHAERIMLEKIVPKTLFDKVVQLKEGKGLNENSNETDSNQNSINLDESYANMIDSIRKTHSPEQVEAILGTIEREQKEVLEILERDGGDLDEIIAQVRTKTRQRQMEILQQINVNDTDDDALSQADSDKHEHKVK